VEAIRSGRFITFASLGQLEPTVTRGERHTPQHNLTFKCRDRPEALSDGRILAKDTHRVGAAKASPWMKCLLARATRKAWR
jgi:hypothetical protein